MIDEQTIMPDRLFQLELVLENLLLNKLLLPYTESLPLLIVICVSYQERRGNPRQDQRQPEDGEAARGEHGGHARVRRGPRGRPLRRQGLQGEPREEVDEDAAAGQRLRGRAGRDALLRQDPGHG